MRGPEDHVKKFEATLDQMKLSKEKHEALTRKYMRDIDICTKEARRIYALRRDEPSVNTREHALSILRRRAILQRSVMQLRARIASLFQHELSLEQGMLLADHIATVKCVRDTLSDIMPNPDSVHDLVDTVNTMTDRVCEVSELLAEPQLIAEVSDVDLERELMDLMEEPPRVLPVLPALPSVEVDSRAPASEVSDTAPRVSLESAELEPRMTT